MNTLEVKKAHYDKLGNFIPSNVLANHKHQIVACVRVVAGGVCKICLFKSTCILKDNEKAEYKFRQIL